MTLEGFEFDRTRLEELYNATDDNALKHRIIESIHRNRVLYLGLLIKGPLIWGLDRLARAHNPTPISRPKTMLNRLGSSDSIDYEITLYNEL